MSNVAYKRERHVPFSRIYKDTNHISHNHFVQSVIFGAGTNCSAKEGYKVNLNPYLLPVFYKIVAEDFGTAVDPAVVKI